MDVHLLKPAVIHKNLGILFVKMSQCLPFEQNQA